MHSEGKLNYFMGDIIKSVIPLYSKAHPNKCCYMPP